MEEKKLTVRRQKIIKDHTKLKMIVFGLLVLAVNLTAAFAPYLTPAAAG